jgi:hypothetical protein
MFEGAPAGAFFAWHIGNQLNFPHLATSIARSIAESRSFSPSFLHIPGLIFTIFTWLIY